MLYFNNVENSTKVLHYIISCTAGRKNWVLQPEGCNSTQGEKSHPEGWIRQPEGCKTQFFLTASAWKHISFTYICALVKFIPWDEFCNPYTQNFREINSSHGYALKNSSHGMNFVILTLRISVKSTKTLIWRNFCRKMVRMNLRNFHCHVFVSKIPWN